MKPIAVKDLTPPQRRALSDLWRAESVDTQEGLAPAFPGAVGHVGCNLVRKGLAESLGEFRYATGHRLIRYQLTEAGRRLADQVRRAGDTSGGNAEAQETPAS